MNIQNVARDLIRKLPPALCSQSEKQVAVKVSVSKSVCQLAQVNLPFLHPSSFWRSAYQSGHVWRQCICQNEELIEQFWSQCGHHPALAEHKVKRIHNFRHRAIPVVLHGDGASVTQNIGSARKSCMFLSWRSLCTPTPQHFLITALWTTMKAQGRIGCSVKSIFRIVSSFFEDLLAEEGRFSNGYFPVLCFSTGDIEYFNQWHLQPRWNATLPCPLCSVHQKQLADLSTVHKMAPDPWRDQRPHQQCPLFRNVMSQKAISPDYMHSKHLGIDGRFLGSVCWLIIFQLMDQQMPLDHRLGQLLFQTKDPWRCLMHFFGIHFFVFFLATSQESWKPGYSHLNNLTLGLLVYLIPPLVWIFGFGMVDFFRSLAGMIINPNERSAKKVFPRLKTKSSETMCAVKALAVVFRTYMQASFLLLRLLKKTSQNKRI